MLITKRDKRVVAFDESRIYHAIERCFHALDSTSKTPIKDLVQRVVNVAETRAVPHVEYVQDIVESTLQAAGEFEAAKQYILYRNDHANKRDMRPVPFDIQQSFAKSDAYFPTQLQKFQFYDKYSRYNYTLGRRETWVETVDRAVDFLYELADSKLPGEVFPRLRHAILTMRVMPSMRLLAMAGPAARRNNLVLYNCAYMPVEDVHAFGEALTISMSGCGVGFSVERHYVESFPRIKRQRGVHQKTHVIEDSAEGWATALQNGIATWFEGEDLTFDLTLLRPAGTPLRIKGGRASGPEPLRWMLEFVRSRILARQGSFLRPIDAHDIMCAVGNAAVSGGMRRTAMLSLFDHDDTDMRLCKDGNLDKNPQRWNANNSTVWPDCTQTEFITQFMDMVRSNRGEPGMFNRVSAQQTRPGRRQIADFGMNPCGEIILRPYGLCNLSSIVARADDTSESLAEKLELATIIGTIQTTAVHFPGLRAQWQRNCEQERLLGVDISGQLDCPAVQHADLMDHLQALAVQINRTTAHQLGMAPAAAITCVKPSGNSSTLLNCSSGLHARWSPYYIRNVRVMKSSPIYKVLRDAGAPMSPENGQAPEDATTWIVHFPVKSPENAITRADRSAIEQCDYWLTNKIHWTEHNPSVTITYNPDEVLTLMQWVWEHHERIGGMSFLPSFDSKYDNMPYVEISKDDYDQRVAAFPIIDFSKIYRYEEGDLTTAAHEVACSSGACDMTF